MSGGSLNYLCFCESSELFYCKEEIETVEYYLQEKAYCDGMSSLEYAKLCKVCYMYK